MTSVLAGPVPAVDAAAATRIAAEVFGVGGPVTPTAARSAA